MKKLSYIPFIVVLLVLLFLACQREFEDPEEEYVIEVTAYPNVLWADSVSESTIWARVTIDGEKVPDSTMVQFATTLGSITERAFTLDGLAKTILVAGKVPGVAVVVGYINLVCDSINVTLEDPPDSL